MKKISFILILALTLVSFVSCNDDDDGPSIAYQLAEITGETLPDFFEPEEEYDITVTYELPDACNEFYSFDGVYHEDEDDESVLIYDIRVLTTYDPNVTECTEEGELTETKTLFEDFGISSDFQYETVRFRFLTGANEDDEAEFLIVDVPVGAPEEETPAE